MHRGLASAVAWIGIPLVAAAALLPGLRAGLSLDGAFGLRLVVGASLPVVVVLAWLSGIGAPPAFADAGGLDLLEALRSFVADRYGLVDAIDGWPVYRLASAEG